MFQVIATPPLSKDTITVAKNVSFQVAITLGKIATIKGYKDILIVENFYGSLKTYFKEIPVK